MLKHKSQKQFYADYAIKNGQNLDESTLNLYAKELKKEVDDAYNLISIFANLTPLNYESTTEYREGEIVSHNNVNYIALKDTVANEPPNDKYWAVFDDFATSANLSKLTDFLSKTNQTPYNPEELTPGETSTAYHPATLKFVEDRINYHLKNSIITNSDRLDGFHASHFATKQELDSINMNIQTDTTMYDPYKLPFKIEDIPTIIDTPVENFKNVLDTNNFNTIYDKIKLEKKYFLKLGKNQVTHYEIEEVPVEYQVENPDYIPPTTLPGTDENTPVVQADTQDTQNTTESGDIYNAENTENVDTTSPTLTKTKYHRILKLGIAGPFKDLGCPGYTNGLIFMIIELDTLNDTYISVNFSSNCYRNISEYDYNNLDKKIGIINYIIQKNDYLKKAQNLNTEKINEYQYKVVWEDPDNVILGDIVTATFEETKLVMKEGSFPENENDGTLLVTNTEKNKYETDGFLVSLFKSGEYYFRLFSKSKEGLVTASDYHLLSYSKIGKDVLSVQIDQNENNTITNDYPNLNKDEIMEFIGCYPCILEDGVETTKLNPNDYTKDIEGNPVDISTLGKDVMIAFPRRGLRISTAENVISIKMTKDQNSNDADYYAHTYGDERKDIFYIGVYPSSISETKAYSSSGKSLPSGNITIDDCASYFANRGDKFTLTGFYQYLYIQCCWLLLQNDLNIKNYFSNQDNHLTGYLNNTGLNNLPETLPTKEVKVFGIEDFWNPNYFCLGGIKTGGDGKLYLSKGPYFTDSEFVEGVDIPQGTGSSYLESIQASSETGFLFGTKTTETTNFFCDFEANTKSIVNSIDFSSFNKNNTNGNFTSRLLCFLPQIQNSGIPKPTTDDFTYLTQTELKKLMPFVGNIVSPNDGLNADISPESGEEILEVDTDKLGLNKGIRYFKKPLAQDFYYEITEDDFNTLSGNGVISKLI